MMELTINNKKLFLVTGDIFEMKDQIEQLILTVSGSHMAFMLRDYFGTRSVPYEKYALKDIPHEVKKMLDLASDKGIKSVGMNAARTIEAGRANYEGQGAMIKACMEWLESHSDSSIESIYLVDMGPHKNFETAYYDFIKKD